MVRNQRDYAKEYRDRNARAIAEGYDSYGQKRYRTEKSKRLGYADLQKYRSWKRAIEQAPRGYTDQTRLAELYRKGFLTVGSPASQESRDARRLFLSTILVFNTRSDLKIQKQINTRAKEIAEDTRFGQGTLSNVFDWRSWREEYNALKNAA